VYPRPRSARRDQPAFKVKSVLKGTEYEVSRQELVGWLHQQIAEQKRIDTSTAGARVLFDNSLSILPSKDVSGSSDVQLLLPIDVKKQRKQVKQIFLDRAFETGVQVKSAVQAGMPVVAIDVPPTVLDSMIRSSAWITEDEAWRNLMPDFLPQHFVYASQVREAVAKRKAEGLHFILLFAVREERIHLLNLS